MIEEERELEVINFIQLVSRRSCRPEHYSSWLKVTSDIKFVRTCFYEFIENRMDLSLKKF